jgi:hypothetical protein
MNGTGKPTLMPSVKITSDTKNCCRQYILAPGMRHHGLSQIPSDSPPMDQYVPHSPYAYNHTYHLISFPGTDTENYSMTSHMPVTLQMRLCTYTKQSQHFPKFSMF